MRKPEQAMWSSNVKPVLDRLAGRVAYARHEDKVTPGTPDLDYAAGDSAGWIELKRITAPSNPDNNIYIDHLTKQQVNFLQSRGQLGAKSWVLVQVDDILPEGRPPSKSFYLWHHSMLEHLESPGVSYSDWRNLATMVWDGMINPTSFGITIGALQ